MNILMKHEGREKPAGAIVVHRIKLVEFDCIICLFPSIFYFRYSIGGGVRIREIAFGERGDRHYYLGAVSS